MSSFLASLAARALGHGPVLRVRIPSRYSAELEGEPGGLGDMRSSSASAEGDQSGRMVEFGHIDAATPRRAAASVGERPPMSDAALASPDARSLVPLSVVPRHERVAATERAQPEPAGPGPKAAPDVAGGPSSSTSTISDSSAGVEPRAELGSQSAQHEPLPSRASARREPSTAARVVSAAAGSEPDAAESGLLRKLTGPKAEPALALRLQTRRRQGTSSMAIGADPPMKWLAGRAVADVDASPVSPARPAVSVSAFAESAGKRTRGTRAATTRQSAEVGEPGSSTTEYELSSVPARRSPATEATSVRPSVLAPGLQGSPREPGQLPGADATRAAGERSLPRVTVHIGRIEVRANAELQQEAPRPELDSGPSLDDYLKTLTARRR